MRHERWVVRLLEQWGWCALFTCYLYPRARHKIHERRASGIPARHKKRDETFPALCSWVMSCQQTVLSRGLPSWKSLHAGRDRPETTSLSVCAWLVGLRAGKSKQNTHALFLVAAQSMTKFVTPWANWENIWKCCRDRKQLTFSLSWYFKCVCVFCVCDVSSMTLLPWNFLFLELKRDEVFISLYLHWV